MFKGLSSAQQNVSKLYNKYGLQEISGEFLKDTLSSHVSWSDANNLGENSKALVKRKAHFFFFLERQDSKQQALWDT